MEEVGKLVGIEDKEITMGNEFRFQIEENKV